MKVIAKKRGYIHSEYKKVGAKFECSEQEFSDIWMTEDIKDIPSKPDNAKAKKAEEVKHEPLEIPSLMPEFSPEAKAKKAAKKPAKKKAPKKTTKKAD